MYTAYKSKLSNRYLTLSLLDKIFPYNFVQNFFYSLAFERFYRIGDIYFSRLFRRMRKKTWRGDEKLKKLRWDFDRLIMIWKLALLYVFLMKMTILHLTVWSKLFQVNEKVTYKIKRKVCKDSKKRRIFLNYLWVTHPQNSDIYIKKLPEFSIHKTIWAV